MTYLEEYEDEEELVDNADTQPKPPVSYGNKRDVREPSATTAANCASTVTSLTLLKGTLPPWHCKPSICVFTILPKE